MQQIPLAQPLKSALVTCKSAHSRRLHFPLHGKRMCLHANDAEEEGFHNAHLNEVIKAIRNKHTWNKKCILKIEPIYYDTYGVFILCTDTNMNIICVFVNMLKVRVQTEVELVSGDDPTNHSPAKDRGDEILLVGT